MEYLIFALIIIAAGQQVVISDLKWHVKFLRGEVRNKDEFGKQLLRRLLGRDSK